MVENHENRISALDGVRGVAVLTVLFYHFTPDLLMPDRIQEWLKKIITTGGWAGVDLFFVLSGFLITGILLRAKSQENYFLNFYARRVLRIFPLYYGMLFLIFVILPGIGIIHGMWFAPIQEAQPWHWFYVTNFGTWLLPAESWYAPGRLETRHFWSLAVEEHFYLAWPAVVYACRLRTVQGICVGLILSAFCFRVFGVFTDQPNGFFTLTFCRWDALAVGALVATIVHKQEALELWRKEAVGTVFMFGLFLLTHLFVMKGLWSTAVPMLTFGVSIVALGFGAFIFLTLYDTRISRVLSNRPLRLAGKYSYGAYVIHGVIAPGLATLIPTDLWVAQFGQSLASVLALGLVKTMISFLLAGLSWHLFEQHFLKLKIYFTPGPTREDRQRSLDNEVYNNHQPRPSSEKETTTCRKRRLSEPPAR